MAPQDYTVTLRFSRLWLWALRAACWMTALGVRAVNWLAAHPRVKVKPC